VLALLAAMRVVVMAAIVFVLCMVVVVSVVVLVSSSPDPAPKPTTRISAPRAAAGTHCTRLWSAGLADDAGAAGALGDSWRQRSMRSKSGLFGCSKSPSPSCR